MQGRSVFGGMTAASSAALAMRVADKADRPIRLAHLQLVAPVLPGPLHGAARILREGRNTTFVEVRLEQENKLRSVANFVFTRPLETEVVVAPPPCPEVAGHEDLPALPYVKGLVPEFMQHIDARWARGKLPYSGAAEAKFVGHFRYREPVGDIEGLLAMLDTFPSPTLSILSKPAPASTVAWTAHLLSVPRPEDEWFTMTYETLMGAGGMHTCMGYLYGSDGTCLAWSEQLFAVFSD